MLRRHAAQAPLTCGGHTRPVVDLAFSAPTPVSSATHIRRRAISTGADCLPCTHY